ncbi:hypothetical protein GCM10010519_18360 [Streptomyces lactacystinicus]
MGTRPSPPWPTDPSEERRVGFAGVGAELYAHPFWATDPAGLGEAASAGGPPLRQSPLRPR